MQYIVNLQSFRVEAVDRHDARIKAENAIEDLSVIALIESVEIDKDIREGK